MMIFHRISSRRSFCLPRATSSGSSSSSSGSTTPSPSLLQQRYPRPFTSQIDRTTTSHNRPLPIPLPQSFTHDTLLTNRRILIANRGEIAIRISRAAKALGAQSVAVCAPEDVTSPHVLAADEFVVLEKGKTAIAPYLDIEGLTKVAREKEVDLVHPGEYSELLVDFHFYYFIDGTHSSDYYLILFLPFFFSKYRVWFPLGIREFLPIPTRC